MELLILLIIYYYGPSVVRETYMVIVRRHRLYRY